MSTGLKDQRWKRLAAWAKATMPPVCWVCTKPIDLTLSGRHPEGWTLDHVLPRKTHPELAYEVTNLRPAHMRCNARKQDGAATGGQRPRVSQRWG